MPDPIDKALDQLRSMDPRQSCDVLADYINELQDENDRLKARVAELEDAPAIPQQQGKRTTPGDIIGRLIESTRNHLVYYLIWERIGSDQTIENDRRQAILADHLESAIAASDDLLQDPDMELEGYQLVRIEWFDKPGDRKPRVYEPKNQPNN